MSVFLCLTLGPDGLPRTRTTSPVRHWESGLLRRADSDRTGRLGLPQRRLSKILLAGDSRDTVGRPLTPYEIGWLSDAVRQHRFTTRTAAPETTRFHKESGDVSGRLDRLPTVSRLSPARSILLSLHRGSAAVVRVCPSGPSRPGAAVPIPSDVQAT